MPRKLEDVEEEALELRLDDRAALAEKLLRSLEGISEVENHRDLVTGYSSTLAEHKVSSRSQGFGLLEESIVFSFQRGERNKRAVPTAILLR